MKRIVIWMLAVMACLPTLANREGERLAELLQKVIAMEEVHPDSLFPSLRMLERKRMEARTPQERVMYNTVLGQLYHMRQYRSQSPLQQTEAPQDSIEEWSRDRYMRTARERFSEALADKELLLAMPTSEWIPLVARGENERFFGSNMLHVVWTAMRESGVYANVGKGDVHSLPPLPSYAEMIAFYKQHNLREAALLLEMDSVEAGPWKNRRADLERIAREYEDLNLSARVLQQLVMTPGEDGKDWNGREQREYRYTKLKELLSRYPKYQDKGSIRNGMLMAQQPDFNIDYQDYLYTGRETVMPFWYVNLSRMSFQLYRLPDNFDENEMWGSRDAVKWLVKHGRMVEHFNVKAKADASPFEKVHDTIQFTVRNHGIYALLVQADTKMKLTEEPEKKIIMLRATHLLPVQMNLNGKSRVTVLDALSGKPQPGVKVNVEWEPAGSRQTDTLRAIFTSDECGNVEIPSQEARYANATFELGEDRFAPRLMLNARGGLHAVGDREYNDQRIFTDRSIYRPGQCIEMTGIVYRQKGWEAQTHEGRVVKVLVLDPDRKVLKDTTMTSDDLGVVACSLPLSSAAKLGMYQITMDGTSKYVSVEEYRRPTFEVKMDEPALRDSIVFAGRALTYAGVPVRNARVTGRYQWREGWWKGVVNQYYAPMQADTVWTDDEGRFTLRVPNNLSDEEKRWGRRMTLTATVLNHSGESHSAEASASVCSTPLRLSATISDLQDKQRLKPWRFELVDALEKEVQGEVKLQLMQEGKAVYETKVKANKKQIVSGLKDISSGAYTLLAQAVVKGDTASWKQRIVLFSMEDNALPVDTASWFYMPADTFTVGRPAHIQVGTSLQDVNIYYVVNTGDKLCIDSLFCLSNSMQTLTIPYQESMQKGASVLFYYVKNHKLYRQNFDLQPLQPDYQLRTRWTSFRDRVRPGQQEQWSLQITRPDGTPAQANLLATLYDASLDALRSHSLTLNILRNYQYNGLYPRANTPGNYATSIYFSPRLYKENGWMYSRLDDKYFLISMRRSGGKGFGGLETQMVGAVAPRLLKANRMVKATGLAIPEHEISFSIKGISAKDFEGLGITDVDEALQGRIAGLDIVESSAEQGTGAAMRLRGAGFLNEEEGEEELTDWSALRTNFNEAAFFLPRLRSDKDGRVTLDFTLPESLTRWHFLGLAHTRDMLTAQLDEGVVAQKELMAQLFLPRFLRVGDKAVLTANIQNISEEENSVEKGAAVFEIMDAKSEKVLLHKNFHFALKSSQDTVFYVPFEVKDADSDLVCRWVANGASCCDGEQRLIPVLADRVTLTRTQAITLSKEGMTSYDLQHLFPQDATNQHLTVEYTTHPVWCAIQSLPGLLHYRHEDILSLVSSYYASTLCKKLVTEIKAVGEVLDLNTDTLDVTRARAINKVKDLQLPNGAFIWFPGMMPSSYLTREVAFQLARLQSLLGSVDADTQELLDKAVAYMRSELRRDSHLSTTILRHLYIVSVAGKSLVEQEKRLLGELAKTTDEWSIEDRALASIVLHIQNKGRATNRMLDGVEKYLVGSPETGRYIDYPSGSFTSIDRKIHIHTQIMEAVMKVRPEDQDLWRGMRRWLLQEKRTTDWDTPINTVDAVYALLSVGTEELGDEALDVLDVKGKGKIQRLTSPDNRKGYLKKEIELASPKSLSINKKSAGESWGAVYAQFDQQMDSVSSAWQGINIRRELSNLNPRVGDRIHVRYVIKATMDYEYVLLHAPRPSSTEPTQAVSGYAYSNGLGYYRTVRDSATDYYICNLPKGTYVLEEDVMVEREGSYNVGVTTVECLYAPEYRAYTGNLKIKPTK